MADFAIWVSAAEPYFGWKAGDFCRAYEKSRTEANSFSLDASAIGAAIRILAEQGTWEGTAAELLDSISAGVAEKDLKSKSWPKSAPSLSNHLRRIVPNLRTEGIEVTFFRTSGKKSRLIRIERKKSDASDAREEDTDFAQDSREDWATPKEGPATPSDAGVAPDASQCAAPSSGGSAKNSHKINGVNDSVDSVAEKRPHSKPDSLTDTEVFA
jgi:hypothetical protein